LQQSLKLSNTEYINVLVIYVVAYGFFQVIILALNTQQDTETSNLAGAIKRSAKGMVIWSSSCPESPEIDIGTLAVLPFSLAGFHHLCVGRVDHNPGVRKQLRLTRRDSFPDGCIRGGKQSGIRRRTDALIVFHGVGLLPGDSLLPHLLV
jgi:hypothetical protein